MADLAPPTIVGPISACETSIWLDNVVVLPGVVVQISVNGIPRGAPVAASAMSMAIAVGVLATGDVISAKQFGGGFGGNPSPPTAQVVVGPAPSKPSDVNPPLLALPLHRCSMCARFTNIAPGGAVFVRDASNKLLGSAPGIAGTALVNFTAPALAEPLTATQIACGFTASVTLPPLLAAPSQPLPAPVLKGPILRCQPSAYLSGLLSGATVELQVLQNGGTYTASTCATATEGWIAGFPALNTNDIVQVIQRLGDCAPNGTWSNALVVTDAPAPTPQLAPTVCETDELLHISNLFSGALVEVDYGGPETLSGQSSGTTYDMPLPINTLGNATVARARQRLSNDPGCDWGDWSVPALVIPDQAGPAPGQPSIFGPIYECGAIVRVNGLVPGGFVGVVDVTTAPGSTVTAPVYADKDTIDISIPGGLLLGHAYAAFESVCGTPTVGPPTTALPLPNRRAHGFSLTPFVQNPIYDCGSIHITNLIPGATVDLFCDVGQGLQWAASQSTPLAKLSLVQPPALAHAAARQRICGLESNLSSTAGVAPGSIACAPGGVTTVCALTRQGLPDVAGGDEILIGTDLGIPIEHGGQLYLLFGDALPTGSTPASPVKPIFRIAGGPECPILDPLPANLALAHPCSDVASYEKGSGVWFESLFVDNLPLDESFQVPSGGFSYDGKMYVFVTHRVSNKNVAGLVGIGLPGDIMLQSFLVSRSAQCETFQLEFGGNPIDEISDPDGSNLRFINIAARVYQNNGQLPELPNGDLLLLWGTGLYRLSGVFFAWVSLTSGQPIPDPSKWNYLTSESPPVFVSGAVLPKDASNLAGLTLSIPSKNILTVEDAGEISVSWIPGLSRWLMLPSGNSAIGYGFVAQKPWGPWTSVELFDFTSDASFDVGGDNYTIVINQLPQSGLPFGKKWYGYGNCIIDRFTEWDPDGDAASVYFILSVNSQPTLKNGDKDINSIGPDPYYGAFLVRARLRCG